MKNALKRYWPALAGIAFTFLLAFTLHLVRSHFAQIENFPTRPIQSSESTVSIQVGDAATGLEIAKDLYSKGVTASITSFYQLAISDPRAISIAPGEHLINKRISAKQALEQLLDPKRVNGLISIIEGAWRSEILQKLKSAGFSNVDSAIQKLKIPKNFSASEGIYFPAQYSFAKGTTSVEALQSMVDRFQIESKRIGLNTESQLIIASLIQAEGDPKDFSKISRVISNRLKIGMPLQLDTTVQYIFKKRGSIYLSENATQINSPYNTYKRFGLPVAPIGNPGVAAMRAALNPEPGDWLYFITVKPGDTRFTKSHDEFLQWKNEYLKNLKAGMFK